MTPKHRAIAVGDTVEVVHADMTPTGCTRGLVTLVKGDAVTLELPGGHEWIAHVSRCRVVPSIDYSVPARYPFWKAS